MIAAAKPTAYRVQTLNLAEVWPANPLVEGQRDARIGWWADKIRFPTYRPRPTRFFDAAASDSNDLSRSPASMIRPAFSSDRISLWTAILRTDPAWDNPNIWATGDENSSRETPWDPVRRMRIASRISAGGIPSALRSASDETWARLRTRFCVWGRSPQTHRPEPPVADPFTQRCCPQSGIPSNGCGTPGPSSPMVGGLRLPTSPGREFHRSGGLRRHHLQGHQLATPRHHSRLRPKPPRLLRPQ